MKRIESMTTPGGWLVTGSAESIRRLREKASGSEERAAETDRKIETEVGEPIASTPRPLPHLARWLIHPWLRRRSTPCSAPEA